MGRFRTNALRIFSGTAVGQVILLSALPILTRMYEAEDFGRFAIFMTAHVLLSTVASMKLDLAVMLPKEDNQARDLTVAVILLGGGIAWFLLLPVLLATILIAKSDNWYLIILPLSITFAILNSLCQVWSARRNNFGTMARANIINAATNAGISVILGFFDGARTFGMPLAATCGICAGVVFFCTKDSRQFIPGIWMARRAFHFQSLLAVIKKYRNFPVEVMPAILAQNTAGYAPPVIVTSSYGLEVAGHFSLATRALSVPLAAIGSALSESFRAEFIMKMKEGSDLRRLLRAVIWRLLLVSIPMFIAIALMGPVVIGIALGSSYAEVGFYIALIAIGSCGVFIAQPFSFILVAVGQSRASLLVQLVAAILPNLVLLCFGLVYPINIVLSLWALTTLGCSLLVVLTTYLRCPRLHA